jgi:hypothetical protein
MIKHKNLRLYEALAHEAAMDAAERRELTPDQREVSRRMLAAAHARLAEMDRADTNKCRNVRPAIPRDGAAIDVVEARGDLHGAARRRVRLPRLRALVG